MLEDVDLSKLEVKGFSGAEAGPNYKLQHPAPQSTPETTPNESELKLYNGNCHCGQYKFSLNIPELKKVWTCDCSICTRVHNLLSNPRILF